MKQEQVYVGVDVAQRQLDVAWEKERRCVGNDAAGWRSVLKCLGKIEGAVQVICEASGGYERGFVQILQGAGIKVSLVQASRVHQFARAAGILAKTDSIDASVLCAFGEAMRPEPTAMSDPKQQKLCEMESHRRHLSALLVAEQNRGAKLSESSMRALNKRLIRQMQKQIAQVDLLIKELIE